MIIAKRFVGAKKKNRSATKKEMADIELFLKDSGAPIANSSAPIKKVNSSINKANASTRDTNFSTKNTSSCVKRKNKNLTSNLSIEGSEKNAVNRSTRIRDFNPITSDARDVGASDKIHDSFRYDKN